MLRSLRQAMYQVENHGHFGLGYEAYTHFTSPIRRYPDLMVHRAIRSVIRSETPSAHVRRVDTAKAIPLRKIYPYSVNDVVTIGEQCSRTERRADEATRDVVSWLKCEYLRDQVGAVFNGHISSVTSFGLFVELNDLYVEGLIHITALPHDYYRFEPAQHRLVGERMRKVFGLGDELVVRVVRVDLDNRKIDFELESEGAVRKPRSAIKPKVAARGKGGAKTGGKNRPVKAAPQYPAKQLAPASAVEVRAKKVKPSSTAAKVAVTAKTAVKPVAVDQAALATKSKPAAKNKTAVKRSLKASTPVAEPKIIRAQSKKPAPLLTTAEKKLATAKAAMDKALSAKPSGQTKAGAKPKLSVKAPAAKLSRAARKAEGEKKLAATQKVASDKPRAGGGKKLTASSQSVASEKNAPKGQKNASKTAAAAVPPAAPKTAKKSSASAAPKTTAKRKVVKPAQSD
jgi:ribonuclease R